MRANITEKGVLIIIPENSIEVYALKTWAKDYFSLDESSGAKIATLRIIESAVTNKEE